TDATNIQQNKAYYDQFYTPHKLTATVQRARNWQAYLEDAKQTHTSWRGLYANQFETRLKGKKVLELGSGDGLNALIMAMLGATVFAIDISEASQEMLAEAADLLDLTNITAASGDFSEFEFDPQSFDFVVGKGFLHHLTHETERAYLAKAATLLKREGEARFFEPAVNSQALDQLRWMIPIADRPSSLNRKAFAEWQARDPHPLRDNSSGHYQQLGVDYFSHVAIEYLGSIERLYRLVPRGSSKYAFRRWAHRADLKLPRWVRHMAARSQLIVYTNPMV
ncbi:MAG: class I SAM-dependent methyltransferase, partial [Candidatus Promineifilaceae bacterium]